MKFIDKASRGALCPVVVLALGCLIAACGSASSSSGSASPSSSTTTTASAAAGGAGSAGSAGSTRRAALVACLKQHGVTLPARPPGAPGGGSSGGGTGTGTTGTGTTPRRGFFGGGGFAANPKLRAALQACGARFGSGGGGRFRGRLSHTAITKYVTCVREHGYDLPNPNFSGKGPVFPANIRNNAKFQAASRACQSLLVPPRPSGSGGGTSTTAGA